MSENSSPMLQLTSQQIIHEKHHNKTLLSDDDWTRNIGINRRADLRTNLQILSKASCKLFHC